jgi:hypothetical protein
MVTVLDSDVTGFAAKCAVAPDTSRAEFADVLMADDQWVRQEFDAIIAAGWGDDVPASPAPLQGSRWPRRPGYRHRSMPVPRPDEPVRDGTSRSHPRGPPAS